jgi:hypothetical protein
MPDREVQGCAGIIIALLIMMLAVAVLLTFGK